jgi:hypothetical protein
MAKKAQTLAKRLLPQVPFRTRDDWAWQDGRWVLRAAFRNPDEAWYAWVVECRESLFGVAIERDEEGE